MAPLNHIFRANARFAERFPGTQLTASPSKHVTILTCMDARIDTFKAFGLEVGDAHILRNAGGRVTDDVIRSLVLSTDVLGTRHVAVIHHTQCGLIGTTNEALRASIEAARPVDLASVDFDPFDDVEVSVLEDLARLRASPLLRSDLEFAGFVYDVEDGRLHRVDPTSKHAPYIGEFRANAGQLGGNFKGVPVLLLHTTDRASGESRITPLTCQPLAHGWAIFGSKDGATTEPAWYLDLLARPDVTIEFGPDTVTVQARVAEGAEREEIWIRQKERMPSFAAYEQAANRTIPVVVLEPRERAS